MYVCYEAIIKLQGGSHAEFEEYVKLFKHEGKHVKNSIKKEEKVKHNLISIWRSIIVKLRK